MTLKRLLGVAALYLLCAGRAQTQVITTVAGTDWFFPTGSLPAVNAPLGEVTGAAVDGNGNVYIADPDNHIVTRVSPDGVLTVVAGNGSSGFSGDGGPAASARLSQPRSVAVDSAGRLYIADFGNGCIRKVQPDGTISTIAGNGIRYAVGVAVGPAGELYVIDVNRIRKITPDGMIGTVAGIETGGFSGDGGPATSAELSGPTGVAVDSVGNLYIADSNNQRIRRVSPEGTISTVAGNGTQNPLGDGGPAVTASFSWPFGVAVDKDKNIYVTDTYRERIRKITPDGVISTVAGNGAAGFSGDGGSATSAQLNAPHGLTVDASGNVYIVDTINRRLRKITTNGTINTIAGNGGFRFSGDGGPAVNAQFNFPSEVAIGSTGTMYLTDSANRRIRGLMPDGTISTIAGNGIMKSAGDGGTATEAAIQEPSALAVDAIGNLYIAHVYGIRKVTPDGMISNVVGSYSLGFLGDGSSAASARFSDPQGVAIDRFANLYIADTGNNRVRKVTPDGIVNTVVGDGSRGFAGDGGSAASAALNQPWRLALDADGNLYIADRNNHRIRKVTPNGAINTIAGNGSQGFSGDGGPAANAKLSSPSGVAVDLTGNLYIADTGNNRIRRVTPDGTISTVVGNGVSWFSGDGGPPTLAALSNPMAVAVDASGNLYIADTNNHRIRKVLGSSSVSFKTSPTSLTFSATAAGAPPPTQSIILTPSIAGVAFTASSSDPWLTITPTTGTMPATLQASVDPAKLTPGAYQGTVTITAPNATPTTAKIAVTFTVQPSTPAKLNINLDTINLTLIQGSALQTAQVQVQNTGGGTLSFSAKSTTSSGGPWLSISPTTGTATSTSPASLTITATPGSLTPGTYQGTATITGSGSTSNINVTLSISAPNARILLFQTGLTFTAVAQGGTPLPQSFGILNVGQGSMDWEATASTLSGGAKWLAISPSSGTIVQPYLDVAPVNVSIDPTGLTPGDYYGRIWITAKAANSPQSITVVLTVLPAGVTPGPEVRPAALIFTGVAGVTPGSQDVLLVAVQ